jgi:hypothetical protein
MTKCLLQLLQVDVKPNYDYVGLTRENIVDIVIAWLTHAKTPHLHLKLYLDQTIPIDSLMTNLRSLQNVVEVERNGQQNSDSKQISVHTRADRCIMVTLQTVNLSD